METMVLNLLLVALPDQQKSHEHSHRKVRCGLSGLDSAYQPLKQIKDSLVVKHMQTCLFY